MLSVGRLISQVALQEGRGNARDIEPRSLDQGLDACNIARIVLVGPLAPGAAELDAIQAKLPAHTEGMAEVLADLIREAR